MGQMDFFQSNINNSSRSGQKDVTLVEHDTSIPLREFYLIVEGENTERYYIKYLKEKGKLPFDIKEFEKNEDDEKENKWKIIDGIKCLCGGDYWNKMKTVEQIYKGITSIPGMRPNIICIFDLDKCIDTKEDAADFFQTYKNDLLPLCKNDHIFFLC